MLENLGATSATVGVVTVETRHASDLTWTYVGPRLVRSPKFAMMSPSNGDRVAARVFDEVNEWGIATLERAIEGLKCETAIHICYGYGIKANTDWKNTLGSEWRQYEEAFPKLQQSNIDIEII